MSKALGYGLMIAGLAVIVIRLLFAKALAKIPITAISDPQKSLIIFGLVGLVLIILGATMSGEEKVPKHLPIYDKTGKKIIGYRQTK